MSVLSGARCQQLEADHRDDALTALALAAEPRRRHWWGRRWLNGQNGAHCYLCGEMIATWSSRVPITIAAQDLIAQHRAMHIRDDLDVVAPSTTEKS